MKLYILGILVSVFLLSLPATAFAGEGWERPIDCPFPSGNYYYYGNYAQYGSEIHHTGVDIPCPAGNSVYASDRGQVYLVEQGWMAFWGWSIFIYHGRDTDGFPVLSFYTHLQSPTVSQGDFVKRGEQIGISGRPPGNISGHLHWGRSTMFPEKFWTYEIHARDNNGSGWDDPMKPPDLEMRVNKSGELVSADEADESASVDLNAGGGKEETGKAVPFGAPEQTQGNSLEEPAFVPDISGGMLVGRVLGNTGGSNIAQPGAKSGNTAAPFIIAGAVALILLGVAFYAMSNDSFGF